ncbi:MAG: DUF1538 domain-containing protein, partial [Bacillota bacterium]|nr:DUF1538 domain-containing protein [Bacillota bacterium]
MSDKTILREKTRESVTSVLPITFIVILVCFTFVPVSTDLMLSFLMGAVLLIMGMGFFTLGAETSMTPIGSRIGTALTKSRNLWMILPVSFLLGLAITIAEPDLQVLAEIAPHIDNMVLVITVGVGVGFFLAMCMLRIFLGIKLRWLLLFFYAATFLLAAFSDRDFLSVAFDSGGVTTGPMTVPFIMAFGVGVANIRSDEKAEADSFGLVALCSIGPIITVLILGFLYEGDSTASAAGVAAWGDTAELGRSYVAEIPHYLLEMATALAPIVGIFLIFQLLFFRMPGQPFLRICFGIGYTYIGLVLFLTGVNVGFSSMGTALGMSMGASATPYMLIPLAMVMGWFTISAEPAVYVLEKQVEEISSGTISASAIRLSLSVAVSIAMGLAMVRVLTGVSIFWFLVPGYGVALFLSFFVPPLFTAVAFDSGGVASGPMTATFMLPFAMGASQALGGNILTDAFGLVAMVAMMPLITIQ